ncbi:MAG: transcription antitermination factor NusB [Halofilum sp. (in: g-proteobacteria)]|nr:transcription antitermination factor NusB [Halofilum sp. (in: g-proteobacteria)]
MVGGRALDDALAAQRGRVAEAERPLLQELAYGTVRHWLRLEPVVRARLRKPPKARDGDLHALLVAAVYELDALSTPAHAVVDAAVEATAALGKGWARGLVNAVLRGLLRERDALAPPPTRAPPTAGRAGSPRRSRPTGRPTGRRSRRAARRARP